MLPLLLDGPIKHPVYTVVYRRVYSDLSLFHGYGTQTTCIMRTDVNLPPFYSDVYTPITPVYIISDFQQTLFSNLLPSLGGREA